MKQKITIFIIVAAVIFIVDQILKGIFIDGFRFQSEFIDLVLTYNKGVAFSMFAFLGEYLKYIQIALLLGFMTYLIYDRELFCDHYVAFGMVLGAGSGNIYDRFIHEGVVDYIFWHKWFNFAVFNFADVMINIAIFLILLKSFLDFRKKQKA